MPKTAKNPADYILPLYMNGLNGRMLRLSPPKNKSREILIIYGHHSSLERMFGMAEYINRYGGVTIPDLPGFGGMQPFYKIGEKPTLDNLADYLASFIKLRYSNRRLSIMAISLGFAITTRMLQKYPELAKKVDLLVSVSGFVNGKEFRWKRRNFVMLRGGAWVVTHRLPAAFVQHIALRGPLIRGAYRLGEAMVWQKKFEDADAIERKRRLDFEINLWKINDIRTYMTTAVDMMVMNLVGIHVDLPVHHVAVADDHYFDNALVEEHMRAIYSDFDLVPGKTATHAPTIIATADEVAIFVPPKIRKLLNQKV